MSDEQDGNKDDCAVDFKYDTEGPATCWLCGDSFPMDQLDHSASEPLCPRCQERSDWEDKEDERIWNEIYEQDEWFRKDNEEPD